jgi:hypothetical protein
MEASPVYQAKRPGVMKTQKRFPDLHPPCKTPFADAKPRRLLEGPHMLASRNVTAAASIWEPRIRLTRAAKLFLPARAWDQGSARGRRRGVGGEGFFPEANVTNFLHQRCLSSSMSDRRLRPVIRFLKQYVPDKQPQLGFLFALGSLRPALVAAARIACLFSMCSLWWRSIPNNLILL